MTETAAPIAIHRHDYAPTAYAIPTTHLTFRLLPKATEVISRLSIERRSGAASSAPLVLDGVALELVSVHIDGNPYPAEHLVQSDTSLTLQTVPAKFELTIVTLINPDENTALEGLYRSSGNFCTQCEAEGFRKITYYLDRPDVLSVFTVTIEGDAKSLPVMLSNGNPVSQTALPDGQQQCIWHDPFPKPAYLFALVAGDLVALENSFTTRSGRTVLLQIYVQAHNQHLCDYAMAALHRAMQWDETAYGLEYDLDRFMIVAVDDFNMGAMENKGLNIFNSRYVLASAETATDNDFIGVEAVIAHEYFHNWTGNRVTCRDWFQLSLKEGLTVFRDQCFTADLHSSSVKRIQDVQLLRNHQFAEDAGPMAHPIRPDSYVEINNFYTLTVYEKGAEVIRMFHTLLGNEAYQKGVALYFARHDGQAVTCDDFIDAMQDASGQDLTQFRRWYAQAGTPELDVSDQYRADDASYTLTIRQHTPDTPGQTGKLPLLVPIDVALLDVDGRALPLNLSNGEVLPNTDGGGALLHLTEREQSWQFSNIPSKPTLSLLRQFSAPVKARFNYSADTLAFLMANDSDTFNRWEAAQRLSEVVLEALERGDESLLATYLEAMAQVVEDTSIDNALKAEMLAPASFDAIAQSRTCIDVQSILAARKKLCTAVAERCEASLLSILSAHPVSVADKDVLADAAMASRAVANAALLALSYLPPDRWLSLARERYDTSYCMTDTAGALAVICQQPGSDRDECLGHFHDKFAEHKLVIDKWFSLQAKVNHEGAFTLIKTLAEHPSFENPNPNRLRALYGVFASQNPGQFHAADGSGYQWVADAVLSVDEKNPQVAARLVTQLTRWKRYTPSSAEVMRSQLQRISDAQSLSPDVYELVSKSLA